MSRPEQSERAEARPRLIAGWPRVAGQSGKVRVADRCPSSCWLAYKTGSKGTLRHPCSETLAAVARMYGWFEAKGKLRRGVAGSPAVCVAGHDDVLLLGCREPLMEHQPSQPAGVAHGKHPASPAGMVLQGVPLAVRSAVIGEKQCRYSTMRDASKALGPLWGRTHWQRYPGRLR